MKFLLTLTLILIIGLSTVFSQGKNILTGNILFHAPAKKSVKATARDFKSKIDLSTKKLSFIVPVKNFKSKTIENKLTSETSINFEGDISSNTEIKTIGRHIVFIKGGLTINGITKPFEFNALLENKGGVTVVSASFLINGTQFGMSKEMINEFTDSVEVSITATY